MSTKISRADLEKRIDEYFNTHSTKRVVVSGLLVGLLSIGGASVAYLTTGNAFIATGVFAVTSLVVVNIAMFTIVPPTKELATSKALIIGALKNPTRIKAVANKAVQLADDRGRVYELNVLELRVWETLVVPYLVQISSAGAAAGTGSSGDAVYNAEPVQPQRVSTEDKLIDKRKAELSRDEQALLAEREKLKAERLELEARAKESRIAQSKLEDQLARAAAREEHLVRLKENLQRRVEESRQMEVEAAEAKLLKEKAAEAAAKESELKLSKEGLVNDSNFYEAGQGGFDADGAVGLQDDSAGNSAIEARMQELEALESELQERLRYVANVEDDLINRLNLLTEREASVEQTEVNVGIRHD